jgi:hypothetical protein
MSISTGGMFQSPAFTDDHSDFIFPDTSDVQLDWDTAYQEAMGNTDERMKDAVVQPTRADLQAPGIEVIGRGDISETRFDSYQVANGIHHDRIKRDTDEIYYGTSQSAVGMFDPNFLLPSSTQQPLVQQMPCSLPPPYQSYFQHDPGQAMPPRQTSNRTTAPAEAQFPSQRVVFRNLAQAKAAMAARPLDRPWNAPRNDHTIPCNNQERALYVIALLDAMKNSAKCSDKRDAPAFRNRWMPDGSHKPNPQHMKMVCWKLVDIAERLHREGPSSLSIYDSEAMKTVWKSRGLTFAGRIQKLVELLRLSKARCFSLLKGESLYTTVGAPAQKYSSTTTNFDQNGKRDELIAAGRPLVKKKKAANLSAHQNDVPKAEGTAYVNGRGKSGGTPPPTLGPHQRRTANLAPNMAFRTPMVMPTPSLPPSASHELPARHQFENSNIKAENFNYLHHVRGKADLKEPKRSVGTTESIVTLRHAPVEYHQPQPVPRIDGYSHFGALRPATFAQPTALPCDMEAHVMSPNMQTPVEPYSINGHPDWSRLHSVHAGLHLPLPKRSADDTGLDAGSARPSQHPRDRL